MESGSCVVHIRDFGQGIPEKELPFVKQKFYKGSAKGRGAGIGLSVCATIIKAHGGTILAENNPTGGATFRFTLALEEETHEQQV